MEAQEAQRFYHEELIFTTRNQRFNKINETICTSERPSYSANFELGKYR